jgi:hypothetical protein
VVASTSRPSVSPGTQADLKAAANIAEAEGATSSFTEAELLQVSEEPFLTVAEEEEGVFGGEAVAELGQGEAVKVSPAPVRGKEVTALVPPYALE